MEIIANIASLSKIQVSKKAARDGSVGAYSRELTLDLTQIPESHRETWLLGWARYGLSKSAEDKVAIVEAAVDRDLKLSDWVQRTQTGGYSRKGAGRKAQVELSQLEILAMTLAGISVAKPAQARKAWAEKSEAVRAKALMGANAALSINFPEEVEIEGEAVEIDSNLPAIT